MERRKRSCTILYVTLLVNTDTQLEPQCLEIVLLLIIILLLFMYCETTQNQLTIYLNT